MLVLATIKLRLHSLKCGILIIVWLYYSVLCNALLVMVLWSLFLGWNRASWPYLQCVAKHQMDLNKQSNRFQTKHISNWFKTLNKLHHQELCLLWHQATLTVTADGHFFLLCLGLRAPNLWPPLKSSFGCGRKCCEFTQLLAKDQCLSLLRLSYVISGPCGARSCNS